jgi:glycerol-3-phosphate dehydrogenase (NAD(P)+)
MTKHNIAVLGGGSFGTTLANVLASNNHNVSLWSNSQETVDEINNTHKNTQFLGDVLLEPNLKAFFDLKDVTKNVDYVLWAIPTQHIREVFTNNKALLSKVKYHINVAKGLEVSSTKRLSQVFKEFGIPLNRYCLLAGPSHAEEVVHKQVTAVSAISKNEDLAKTVQEMFRTDYLRVYTNPDLVGSELAGAFKNVVAIAAGICDGFGLGDNAKAALITRSISELSGLVKRYDGSSRTLSGLTGVGDLIATCCSKHSRNRFVGEELGKGRALRDILADMVMVAEGVATCEAFHKLKGDIEMPIVEATYAIMFEGKSVKETIYSLMSRESKDEY